MKIAVIGNKCQDKIYNFSKYDYIVRYNGCDSLEQTYTDKTNLWIFGGDPNLFYLTCNKTNIHNYINNNIDKKLICDPHNIKLIRSNKEILYNLIPKYLENINYEINPKLERITTGIRTILHTLYINNNSHIDIYCLDKDRKEKNNWHYFPETEYELLDYLEKNNYISFIK